MKEVDFFLLELFDSGYTEKKKILDIPLMIIYQNFHYFIYMSLVLFISFTPFYNCLPLRPSNHILPRNMIRTSNNLLDFNGPHH